MVYSYKLKTVCLKAESERTWIGWLYCKNSLGCQSDICCSYGKRVLHKPLWLFEQFCFGNGS